MYESCTESINLSLLVVLLGSPVFIVLQILPVSLSLPISAHQFTTKRENADVRAGWCRDGQSNKIINKQELWGFSCHINCCNLTSGGLWRARMIDLPFSVLQLFTHQQQKFQLKCSSGSIFIAADTLEAHVSLQAWIS